MAQNIDLDGFITYLSKILEVPEERVADAVNDPYAKAYLKLSVLSDFFETMGPAVEQHPDMTANDFVTQMELGLVMSSIEFASKVLAD